MDKMLQVAEVGRQFITWLAARYKFVAMRHAAKGS
jgi:hypothetical protein